MTTATNAQLNALWRQLLEACIDYMDETEPGNYQAAMLDVIRKFLNDNNIKINGERLLNIREALSELKGLSEEFPLEMPFSTPSEDDKTGR